MTAPGKLPANRKLLVLFSRWAALCLLKGAAFALAEEVPVITPISYTNVDADSWIQPLLRFVDQNQKSPQVLLWKSYHVLQSSCVGKNWQSIKEKMVRSGLILQDGNPDADPFYCRCILQRNALKDEDGRVFDFCVDFMVNVKAGGEVYAADPHLVCRIHQPLKAALKQNVYRKNNAINRLLTLDDVRKEAAGFPVLEGVDVSYRFISSLGMRAAKGFDISLEFWASRHHYKYAFYAVCSGLDSPAEPSPTRVNPAFQPKDILVDATYELKLPEKGRPGLFWNQGSETIGETIE